MLGRIKVFFTEKGFGFIKAEDMNDYFFHYSQFHSSTLPRKGLPVTFAITINDRGHIATDIYETDPSTVTEFLRGDIVYLKEPPIPTEDILKEYKILTNSNTHQMVILKKTSSTSYLVAFCKSNATKSCLVVETNKIPIYVSFKQLLPVSASLLLLDPETNIIDIPKAISDLYEKHNLYIQQENQRREELISELKKEHLKKIEQQKKKRAEKKNAKQKARKIAKEYESKYELAILNNDTSAALEITKKLGYVPGKGAKGGLIKSNRYTNVNPKNYSGGRFSPK